MIIGFGFDVCDMRRIEKLLAQSESQFLNRCFTPHEQDYARKASDKNVRTARLAKRFAAKEAAAKALGCGIGAEAGLLDIEVRNSETGQPALFLSGKALQKLNSLLPANKAAKLWLSLSDESYLAFAQVILEAQDNNAEHS